MFEAKLTEGLILKKIVESIKDIVTDVNIDISPSGMAIIFWKDFVLTYTFIRHFPPGYGLISCRFGLIEPLHGRF